jgi:hypothetical protein
MTMATPAIDIVAIPSCSAVRFALASHSPRK